MAFSTIFVTFVTESDAESILGEHGLFGTAVSALRPRFAVEVPLGKEQEYVELFAKTEGVKGVSESCIYGKEIKREPNRPKTRAKASDRDPKRSKNEKW